MDRLIPGAIVLAVLVVLVGLMYLGWRMRQRRQAGLPQPHGVPDDTGALLFDTEAFYVATTTAGDPLDRIAVAGLGYRARARVSVRERGLVLEIPGQSDIFVPAADLRAVERATHVIDRVVERDGLIVVRWVLGESPDAVAVESYLRITDPVFAEQLVSQLSPLVPTQAQKTQTGDAE